MDAFRDLTSTELNYLIDLLNNRVSSLQKNSFLSSAECVLIQSIVVKFGWTYEFIDSRFVILPCPNSIPNFSK